jgi:hypothetical protein
MTVRRIVWFGVSGVALASWFAAASTSGVRQAAAPPPPSPTAVDRSMSTLQSEIGKLHDRIAPSAAPTRSRDLFHFSTRVPARTAPPGSATPPVEAPGASPAPQPAAFMLIGIAEDPAADGAPARTAILKGVFDLFLVKPGDSVLGRYRVEQVSSDAVQLVDTTTNLPLVLTLH